MSATGGDGRKRREDSSGRGPPATCAAPRGVRRRRRPARRPTHHPTDGVSNRTPSRSPSTGVCVSTSRARRQAAGGRPAQARAAEPTARGTARGHLSRRLTRCGSDGVEASQWSRPHVTGGARSDVDASSLAWPRQRRHPQPQGVRGGAHRDVPATLDPPGRGTERPRTFLRTVFSDARLFPSLSPLSKVTYSHACSTRRLVVLHLGARKRAYAFHRVILDHYCTRRCHVSRDLKKNREIIYGGRKTNFMSKKHRVPS